MVPEHPRKAACPALRGPNKKQVIRFSAHMPAMALSQMDKGAREALQQRETGTDQLSPSAAFPETQFQQKFPENGPNPQEVTP